MHIITQTRLREFGRQHPDSDGPLRAWETIMRAKKYRRPHEIRADFGTVDFLGSGKTVFDIGGNKYRLVTKILYRAGQVLIRHVVTHREYDRLMKLGTL
ncbi:MAG: type II toxin-antitoxin system HigB family toxin [Gemmatimonadaceae bacterium]|nr:type II toxin-antitoxin system HigB family toxin [Gemmatimonadaceae bacterium]